MIEVFLHICRLCVFLMATVWLADGPTRADQATYALKLHKVSDNRTTVRIYNMKSGRTVWARKLGEIYNASDYVSWSADHRMVAILDAGEDGSFHILTWSAANKVRTISSIPLTRRYTRSHVTAMRGNLLHVDAILQIALSPDKRRLLMRASFGQGSATVDEGELWCLSLRTLRVQQICPCALGSAHWINPRKVSFVNLKSVVDSQGALIRTTETNKVLRVQ